MEVFMKVIFLILFLLFVYSCAGTPKQIRTWEKASWAKGEMILDKDTKQCKYDAQRSADYTAKGELAIDDSFTNCMEEKGWTPKLIPNPDYSG